MFMIADVYAICDKYIAVASYCTVQYSWMLPLAGHEHTSMTLYVARGGLRYSFIPSYGAADMIYVLHLQFLRFTYINVLILTFKLFIECP